MAKKKIDIVTDVIKNISTKNDGGVFMLPKQFVDLLRARVRYRSRNGHDGPWYCSYGKLKLFSCWTDEMLESPDLSDHKARHKELKFNSESGIKGLEEYPSPGKVLLLTTQLGGGETRGNLAAFCELVAKYEELAKLKEPLLTEEEKKFLCEATDKGSSKTNKSPLLVVKSRNLIVFGAPGTGKSRYLNELRLKNMVKWIRMFILIDRMIYTSTMLIE